MAHTYYGSDGLILTSVSRQNFDSGLSRVDCTYKCRTTKADDLEPTLAAGLRLPDREDFLIREKATRKDETDGFTTFTVSGFYATLVTSPNTITPIPSVLGAQIASCDLFTTIKYLPSSSSAPFDGLGATLKLSVLCDTITRKFTMLPTDSVTSLNFPEETLKTKILSASSYTGGGQRSVDELEASFLQDSAVYRMSPIYGAGLQEYAAKSQYIPGTLEASISGLVEIMNINRTSFGSYDEVTVTWGLALKSATVNLVYRIMGWP
jgi:hypothetical protein